MRKFKFLFLATKQERKHTKFPSYQKYINTYRYLLRALTGLLGTSTYFSTAVQSKQIAHDMIRSFSPAYLCRLSTLVHPQLVTVVKTCLFYSISPAFLLLHFFSSEGDGGWWHLFLLLFRKQKWCYSANVITLYYWTFGGKYLLICVLYRTWLLVEYEQ